MVFVRVGENLHAGAAVSFGLKSRCNGATKLSLLTQDSRIQDQLTIFLCGRESSSCLRTGSGFSFSYGRVPWTQAWKSSSSKS
jgi:hypothetical protein